MGVVVVVWRRDDCQAMQGAALTWAFKGLRRSYGLQPSKGVAVANRLVRLIQKVGLMWSC